MTKELLQQALDALELQPRVLTIDNNAYPHTVARDEVIHKLKQALAQQAHFEEQPDGTVIPVDPSEKAQQEQPASVDAYNGAREDVAIWKKRALEAEELNRKFIAELNGPTYLGEPVKQEQPAQEPVAWMHKTGSVWNGINRPDERGYWKPLYTHPAPTQPAQGPCGCREGECETKKDKTCRMTLEIDGRGGIPEWTPTIGIDCAISSLRDDAIRLRDGGYTPLQIADDLDVIANDLTQCKPVSLQEQTASVDAYVGAREDAAIWKKRALEAEELNRKFIAELNGPTYLGEPAQQEQPAQEASATWTEMVVANLVREGVNKHRARELAAHFLTLPTQPSLSDDEILNCFYASKSEGMASYMLAVGRAIEAHCRGGAAS